MPNYFSMNELKGNYDAVICGTGLTESLVSGCLSQAGKHVIHFDREEYGGCRVTKGINDFINWVGKNGEILVDNTEEKLKKPVRNSLYSIDLMPMTVFSRDDLIRVLINSNNFECVYLSLIDGMYYRKDCGFHSIPASKSAIFQDKTIPLKQKRAVMKFISYFFPQAEFGHLNDTENTKQLVKEYEEKPFSELLKKMGFDDDLVNAFEYFVALAPSDILTKEAVPRINEFCNSVGVYGISPLLAFNYGSSEAPQIFSRYSAVYGGTFVLRHVPENVTLNDENKFEMDVNEIGHIVSPLFIASPDNLIPTDETKLIAHREVLILSKSLVEGKGCFVGVIPPNMFDNEKPVYVHQFDSTLKYCDKDQYLVHFSSMCEIRNVVNSILEKLPEDSIILRAAFDIKEPIPKPVKGTYVVPSPNIDELSFGTNYFLKQAKEIMNSIDPSISFYPKPTEVEILVDDEPKEGKKEEKKEEIKEEVKEEKKEEIKEEVKEEKKEEEQSKTEPQE